MWKQYVNYHALRLFYENLEAFVNFANAHGLALTVELPEYEALLYGTNAGIYVPLWASACKGRGDVLMNDVTLAVIQRYRKHGYRHVNMDGNPADYAGEQLRFLEYLSICAVSGGISKETARQVIDRFTADFLLDTLRPTANAIKEYALNSLLPVGNLIEGLIRDEMRDWRVDQEEAEQFDTYALTYGPELPVEEPHQVSIASFSDCGSKCKLLATVAEGCVLSIEPDEYGTPLRFTGCPRGMAYCHTFLSSRRLRYPMERTGERGLGQFRRIRWEDAAERSAKEIKRSRSFGPESRYVMTAAGNCGALRGDRFMASLFALDGGYLAYYNFYSAACAAYILPYIYGAAACGNHVSTYKESKLIILWGQNLAESHYGYGAKEALAEAKERGAEIIAIDPRMSETAVTLADRWIPIKPSSDAALCDAMAYVIFRENLQDQEFMDRFCIGFDECHMPEGIPYGESYRSYLFGVKDGIEKTPAWAEPITGIPADTIEKLAVKYASVKPAALMPGLGPQRTMSGEQVVRCHAALACLTGNVGVAGGSTGTYQAWADGHAAPSYHPVENPYPGQIPTFQWSRAIDRPETIDTGRRGLKGVEKLNSGIKIMFSLGSGILLNQHSNINETIRILRDDTKLEYLVVSDILMTPAARFADVLLPAPSFFEVDNIVGPWSRGGYFLFNNRCLEPLFSCRFELDWILEVAEKLGCREALEDGHKTYEDWFRSLYQDYCACEPGLPSYEQYRRDSCAVYPDNGQGVAFAAQIKDGEPFRTPSGKIEIFSKALYDMGRPEDIPGIPRYIGAVDGPEDRRLKEGKLQLISYHTKKRCHSQHDQNALLRELDPNRVWINPADADVRGIRDGDLVEVFNDYGVVRLPARVTERIMQGVITFSEGGWYTPDQDGTDTGGSINVLTSTENASPLANGNPQQTNIADVRLADGYRTK